MAFVPYYTRVVVQFVLFVFTKVIVLRGHHASPRISFQHASYVIAANHPSGLDPFALLASLRFRDFFRLAPFSFMTANGFMRPLWLRPFAWAAGCFPAYPGLGPYGIEKALSDLEHGYTLVMFPEGKRVQGAPPKAKHGIEIILQKAPHTHLTIARIKWRSAFAISSIRIAHSPQPATPRTADEIMGAIYSL